MANPSPISEAQKTIIRQLLEKGLLPDRYKPNDWEHDAYGEIVMKNNRPVRRVTRGDYHFFTEKAAQGNAPCAQVNVCARSWKDNQILARETVPYIASDNLVNPGDLFLESFLQESVRAHAG